MPRLKRRAQLAALHVVTEEWSFELAVADLTAEALRAGGRLLPDGLLNELLREAIPGWLLEAVAELQPRWDEARRVADKVARDIAHAEQQWPQP